MANKPKNLKPSDYSEFVAKTYDASATMMPFDEWFELYDSILRLVWWNPEVDNQLRYEARLRGEIQ